MKLRNLMGAVLALAGVAFCGTAAGGDVWEFIPDSPTGTNYTAGTTVQFRMRVLTRNYEGPAGDLAPFMKTPNFDNYTVQAAYLADPVHAAETLNADYPLQIGVVANGKTVGAKLVTSNVTNDNLATDFVFAYTVETGDYALPLRLAADANGNPVNSGADTSKFFFFYGPGSGNEIWSIKATTRPEAGGETFTFDPQMVSQGTSETEVLPREVIPYNKDGDYLRATFRFDLETLAFDGESETGDDGKDYWRVVCGNDSKPFAPRIQTIDGLLPLTGGQKVYAWVAPSGGDDDDPAEWNWPAGAEADYAVAIPAGANVLKKAKFTDPDGQEREHNVYVFTLAAGTPAYPFQLEGKHVGETARIILSSSPHWNKIGSTGDWIATDFRVQTVYCGEQKPSISVTDGDGNVKVAVEATTNYTASTMMKIHFDVPYAAGPVTVTLRQKLGDAFVPVDDNFISNRYFSILAEPDGDPSVQPSLERITMPAGQQDVYFYVFALGATADTKNPGLTLVPDVSDQSAEIRAFFAAGNHRSALLKITDQVPVPSVSAPTSGFSQDTIGVDVTVADNWRDLSTSNTNGYKVVIKLGGQTVCETNGVKFSEGDAESFAVKIPMEGHPLKGQVQVWDVTHGNTYGVADFEIDAEAALAAKPAFYPDSASTNAYPEGYFYTEGMSPFLRVNLTSEAKDDMYAFLVPLNEAASNLVECAAYSNGLFIAKGSRSSDTATITFLDGYTAKNPMRALFTVDLRSHEKIDAEGSVSYTSTYDPQKVTLSCVNVPSTVTAVKLDTESIKTGGTFYNVPAMIAKKFRAKVADLSEIDLKYGPGYEGKEIWVRFEYTDDWNGWEQAPSKNLYATNGLNNYAEMDVAFTYEGTVQRVNVYALDKDSRAAGVELDELEWGDPLFTFYVSVSAPQRIIIHDKQKKAVTDEDELVYEEDQMQVLSASSGDFYISLSSQPGSGTPAISKANPIRVKVTLEQYGDGNLDILTNYVYYTTPADMALKPIRIDTTTLNGGRESVWWMTAEVDMADPGATDADGNPWSEHFAAASCMVRVNNVDPVIDTATAKGTRTWSEAGTNTVAVGEAVTVAWKITDITNDFYEADWKDDRFQIEWSVDSSESGYTNPQVITNDWPRKKGIGSKGQISGDYRFNIPDLSGYSTIKMTVTDGDGGFAEKEWIIYVSPSKRAKIGVYGPRATAESKYKAAKGVGQGLVAAKGTIALCEQFAQTWEYDETTADAEFYAFGYPATNTWAQFVAENPGSGASADDTTDAGKIPGYLGYETLHGVPLNTLGNKAVGESPTYYDWATHGGRDPDAGRYDSYFYRWMVTKAASGDKETSGDTPSTPSPTFWPFDGTSKTFTLDAGNGGGKDNKTGPVTYGTVGIEAIFSRELRERDNLGDINADGIPDKIVELYGFGANVGEFPEDDLVSLSAYNDDEDYLPNTAGAAIYSSLIPGLPGSWGEGLEFTARMEVRGFHDGLNDGAKLAGLSQYRFDAGFYSDDVEVRKVSRDYSDVEMMAWAEHGYAKDWSPERPTDPTKEDTDEDKFPDGYEYYFWYKAHVGYMENGVHRYLTGRAYDPKNPGEGKFISAATIARMMDPRSDLAPVDFPEGYVDDASDAKTRDSDNDGLPDALEFEIGTNPFDFDTDGDGLPDGFEIMLGGTDPLLAETTKGVSDAMRNFDGDAMAFTSPFYEKTYMAPKPLKTDMLYTFALVDADGDTDGVQWYVGKAAPPLEDLQPLETCVTGTSFTVGEKTYVTREKVPLVDGRLAADLDKMVTWEVLTRESLTNSIPSLTNLVWIVDETNDVGEVIASLTNATDFVALMPTRFAAGTEVGATNTATYATLKFAEDVTGVNAAWTYGRSVTAITTGDSLANIGGFGMLAIGRYKDAPKGVQIAALPAEDENVAYLHHFVYQEFGFDPRTAWNANTPLAPRWGKTVGEGDSKEVVANNFTANYGYAGVSVRTREYTLYDEFLVMSFFLNNGKLTMADVTATQAFPWEKIWAKYTTNGQGPNEPNWEEDNEHFKGRTAETNSGENGADTDLDGVPDGWELYVMAGPKVEDKETKEFKYNLAAPYNDGFYSSFGPFVKDAAKASVTDNSATGGNASTAGDGDGLTELQEYAGTDSCAYYSEPWGGNEAPFSTTIVRPAEHKDWLNKFFPTDPWNKDTDGDGLGDSAEAGKFKYGKPVDDGKRCAISGGGLNPCTVDTDMDGLPDGWEAQFAGKTVYAGADAQKPKDKDGNEVADGNVLQGYCDGMDGTVFDAYTSPRIKTSGVDSSEEYVVSLDGVAQVVDRDYDKDGLENWQEYLTGAMRCWRYDDPITVWDYVPDAAFFNPMTGEFDLAAAMRHTGIKNVNEFWYRLLFDTKSKWYNPHFVTASTPSSQYFSRVTNGWDQVFSEAGTYYMFYDRRNGDDLKVTWGKDYYEAQVAPTKYIGTSPIDADTDQDGMDDGYELFHGLNPLLGAVGVLKSSNGPCDIVFDAWYVDGMGSPVNAIENLWIKKNPGNGKYDFIAHPWLNGLVDADPDGDDIRNQDEAIMPLVAPHSVWLHTDPTPLWMTDSSYGDSIVSRFFRLPSARGMVPVPESIVFDGQEYSLIDCDGYMVLPLIGPVIAPFLPDYWSVTGEGAANWAYSFEENEGFDTDHDSSSDFEEKQGKFRNATDPQDADSPRRRQAMYFPGQNAALQSMPFVSEVYPRAAMGYPDDMSFLQYTVECWVRPEAADPAKVYTVLERTSFTDPSHVADERYVRRNFAIQIRNGKWSTAFDTNGTLDDSIVEVIGKTDVKVGEWTHVAATYDANRLTLYVNGNEDGYVLSSLKPEYGSSAVITYPAGSGSVNTNDLVVDGSLEALKGTAHAYWFDSEYAQYAFLIGASFRNASDGDHLDVTKHSGWGRYKEFFKGYVDEVRVWDGAQPADVVFSHFSTRKRFTREDALENRSSFYKQWVDGRRRYSKDGDGLDHDVTPELRFHWAFDSIPGAENAAEVAQAPHGFLEGSKPSYSRPSGYRIPWWSGIVGAYGSVYEGERNWVPWIPNTVTHLPRLDMTTLDSAYWSENYAGDKAGTYKFARTAEPVSKWTQYVRNETDKPLEFRTTGRRFWLTHNTGTNATSTLPQQFEFTGRHLNQTGDDLLPLGGAFAKYVDVMWDDQGASSMWEQTGLDDDGDGLPNWWQEYVNQNCREGVPEGTDITWDTLIWYEIGGERVRITAGEAYKRDLAKGVYRDANGEIQFGPTDYAQTAKSDGLIPDWWKELRKIDGEQPLADLDNDGLNNYVEYVASELLPFRLNLDPRMAKSDTKTLDYFRKVGRLYLGEMLTDHDQMEDHWERSLGDESVASAALWDALKDGEKDGWCNFAENRYNGYSMSILAQLVAHAMGDNEVLDAPIPSIKMKVRYNGDRPLAASSEGGGTGNDDTEKSDAAPALVVRAFSKSGQTGDYVMNPDAVWTVTPGVAVDRETYLGGWEDRVVRGTLAPGYVDLGSVNILFAQVPQNDLYSWTDESGTHLAGTYKEFKEAFDKNPNIIQNIQNFEWLSLYAPMNEYTSADKAVTVTRDGKLQENARFAVYGEPVGTINLSTGDFEFDMGAMNKLRVNYTYDGSKGPAAAWSYKEAIFKIVYTAKVPSTQLKEVDFSLAKADKGFVRGGLNSFEAFYDLNGNGAWDPGEPFGVANDVEIGWAGRDVELELTDMSAITPRVKLWGAGGESSGGNNGGGQEEQTGGRASAADSDRGVRVGTATFEAGDDARFEVSTAPAPKSRVRVVRYKVDKFPAYKVGVDAGVVLEKDFEETSRDFLHEGDFLADGDLDIDWKNLYTDVVDWQGAQLAACEVTNVTYLIVYNWDKSEYASDKDTNTQVRANATLVTRRFEVTRTVPTPCPERAVYNQSRPVFAWKIAGEDKWASWFGTTYTAFKVRVKDLKGNLVYDSGVRRLPAMDSEGVYTWAPPLYVGEKAPGSAVIFQNLTDYTWEVAVYNAKFKTDTLYAMEMNDATGKKVFSTPLTFRMNVTKLDTGSAALAVRACYTGPAAGLLDCVRVQAFASPDFTGDPVAETTIRYVDIRDSLSPEGSDANAKLVGLPAGSYFLRAYIDTNRNGVHDEWESWGYLNERDQASKPGIFNPVALAASINPAESNVRKIFIEDCDTDGDWFPDVWEAEQNGGVFVKFKNGAGQGPVTGNAELIGVNTNLDANLDVSAFPMLEALSSKAGLALISGIPPTRIRTVERSDGTLGIQVDNTVTSVKVTKLDFDADGNVSIQIDAATVSGGLDEGLSKFYGTSLDKTMTVTCIVYRKAKLTDANWAEAGREVVTVGGDEPTTVKVSKPVAGNAGFYMVKIVQ